MDIQMIQSTPSTYQLIPDSKLRNSENARNARAKTEERLDQVISPEMMKGLLNLIVPGNQAINNEHSVDITT